KPPTSRRTTASAVVVCQRMARLVRGAPADQRDDPAREHEARQDDERQDGHDATLLGAEEDRRLLRVLRPHRDLVLLLGEPAYGVEEEVAVALHVEELVAGEVRGAVHDDPRLVLGHDRGIGPRTYGILWIRFGSHQSV